MRRLITTVAAILALAAPAAAQLNTYYEGFERHGGKRIPSTAQYAVDAGRAVAVMKGVHAFRMIYLQKEGLLRMILDSDKQYMDVPATEGGLAGSLAAQLESQMAGLPPEQRKMVQDMMKKTQAEKPTAALEYVWTDEKQKVLGYEGTRVDILHGGRKTGEYWGTPSPDFKITEAERLCVVGMNQALHGTDISVKVGGTTRAFLWDTEKDGYPLIMRCFSDTTMTLQLQLTSFDRKPLAKDLFKIPSGYKKPEMPEGWK